MEISHLIILLILLGGMAAVGPVFMPMLSAFHVGPLHFGLILTVNLAIGYCTPPMGVSLYISGSLANRDLVWVSKACLPFLAIQIGVLMMMTYLPDLVLWLPRTMGFADLDTRGEIFNRAAASCTILGRASVFSMNRYR